MELVIKIPDEIVRYIKEEHMALHVCDAHTVAKAIANATPLPKGHGRLVDADALINGYELADFVGDEYDCLNIACHVVNSAPTIIEAENEDVER